MTEPTAEDQVQELLDNVESLLRREWNGLALHRFQVLRQKLTRANESAKRWDYMREWWFGYHEPQADLRRALGPDELDSAVDAAIAAQEKQQ